MYSCVFDLQTICENFNENETRSILQERRGVTCFLSLHK